MPYMETKVYFDGSHYIAVPHTTKPYKPRPKKIEEVIEVEEGEGSSEENAPISATENPLNADIPPPNEVQMIEKSMQVASNLEREKVEEQPQQKTTRSMTKKEYFEELYQETTYLKKGERKKIITERMLPYFKNRARTENYVKAQFERKQRNLICRRIRLTRKVNLQEFNYFCTFTYDGAKHTEETFKKKLQDCFKKMCYRRQWKYVGVWERSPEKKRLHFHGLFYIPEGQMVGELIEVNDYSPIKKRVQHTIQNTYFNERFGRSDFETVNDRRVLGESLAYLMKYLEKTGEKIVYSKGLPQFFISDILDDDVVCRTGMEDKKLLLFDDFLCIDEGEIIGKVSKETIARMRKSN